LPRRRLVPGEDIWLLPHLDRLYLFDAESGKRLDTGR
jgi:hypothetical protein